MIPGSLDADGEPLRLPAALRRHVAWPPAGRRAATRMAVLAAIGALLLYAWLRTG